MFDVVIASPLKTEFKKELIHDSLENFLRNMNAKDLKEFRKKTTAELRRLMISSFITAMQAVENFSAAT